MYTIGEFAAFGRVSVRMLRHYDAIGLLTPARVDQATGYRRYSTEQLTDLLQLVELRELGIGLDAIADVLGAGDRSDALRAALASRHAELAASVADDTARIARIERRLLTLEGETMIDVDYRPVEAVTLYATSTVAEGGPAGVPAAIAGAITGLDAALETARRPLNEPGVFWYEPIEGTDDLGVHISYTADEPPVPGAGYEVVTLPAVPTMATLIHRGDMTGIGESWGALMQQVVADGYRMTGLCREVYLVADGHEPGPDWVTELQVPVERA
ncbi:MerR family transcriptional regulator [Microbacterium terricola]|uniref:MerR family transcriptional regulator n=2 Tax=Microbacterium terricola TaxID=344163 RepID=A0ABM8E0X8_9MICO|nr:MerR family transcriptional regulator [Microbacterium terricola]BDV31598.1 MerR family transcriptional regulator [Microbacterium terricola]